MERESETYRITKINNKTVSNTENQSLPHSTSLLRSQSFNIYMNSAFTTDLSIISSYSCKSIKALPHSSRFTFKNNCPGCNTSLNAFRIALSLTTTSTSFSEPLRNVTIQVFLPNNTKIDLSGIAISSIYT